MYGQGYELTKNLEDAIKSGDAAKIADISTNLAILAYGAHSIVK